MYTFSTESVQLSCEIFPTTLFRLLYDDNLARSHKKDHPDIASQRSKDILKFKNFHCDLCKQIEQVPDGTILTLKYFINLPKKGKNSSWFKQMAKDYTKYIKAAKRCIVLSSF